ncbi:putative sporulation protein YtxC [Pseudalkalibacillus hwajinpoensis]|uniref:putative sporulation protein YtxC n=1 Tax=Guptibacillus hwajinpoensis TaxID=208199 RepID=UPI001CD4FC77|nr:putative sporulation protein YtxC [Pseudalkalibacillus hwajinpoensis]MCA0992467.1 putative sporulation protein YtxC [Pseudalkalibacillus hwajinpoensis]
MVSITFDQKEDFQFVYEHLIKDRDVQQKVSVNEEELTLSVQVEPYNAKLCYHISKCIVRCVSTIYEKRWMKQILTTKYYYHDKDEIGEITAIAKSIGEGDKEELPRSDRYTKRVDLLHRSTFSCIEQGGTILFDSYLRFRTGPYRALLTELIGEAIDEYKLEQEYQNFIEALRLLLKSREALQEKVVLVFDGRYQLYDLSGRKLNGIHETLDNIPNGLSLEEIDSEILLPLLILAPKEIYLYTEDTEEGLAQTIRNVFEERLCFFSLSRVKNFFSGNH